LSFDCTDTFKQAPRPVGNFGANRISLNSTPNECTPHRVTFWNGGVPFAIWGCGRKSETKFVKQNWEVVCKCGFRFFLSARRIKPKMSPRFEKSKFWDSDPRNLNQDFWSAYSDTRAQNLKPHLSTNFQFCLPTVVSHFLGVCRKITQNSLHIMLDLPSSSFSHFRFMAGLVKI